MSEETTMIECLYGPYAGRRLTVSKADAESAIKEGWARDPFKQRSADEPQKEISADERQALIEKAEKAAPRLRGEEPPKEAEAKPKPEAETRSMAAERPSSYETRDVKSQTTPAPAPKKK